MYLRVIISTIIKTCMILNIVAISTSIVALIITFLSGSNNYIFLFVNRVEKKIIGSKKDKGIVSICNVPSQFV